MAQWVKMFAGMLDNLRLILETLMIEENMLTSIYSSTFNPPSLIKQSNKLKQAWKGTHRALAAFSEDSSSIPSSHMVAYNHL